MTCSRGLRGRGRGPRGRGRGLRGRGRGPRGRGRGFSRETIDLTQEPTNTNPKKKKKYDDELKVGDTVHALWHADGIWYKALIIGINDD